MSDAAMIDDVMISLNLGTCKGCEACTSLYPEFVAWDDNIDMPCMIVEALPMDAARELVSYCPEDCFEIED